MVGAYDPKEQIKGIDTNLADDGIERRTSSYLCEDSANYPEHLAERLATRTEPKKRRRSESTSREED
jgi:hypothetical protein